MNKTAASVLVIVLVLVLIGLYLIFARGSEENLLNDEENAMVLEEGYVAYENERFNYVIAYPEEFTPQGEAQNNDGQVFVRGNTTVEVFGTTNTAKENLETIARRYIAEGKRGSVTIRSTTETEVVLEADEVVVKAIDLGEEGVAVVVIENEEDALIAEEVDIILDSFSPAEESTIQEETAVEASLTSYFSQQLTQHEEGAPMPIEGYDAELLIARYEGLTASDFNNVETLQGYYSYSEGELSFEFTAESEHSAARTITEEGYAQLLENLSARLEMSAETEAEIDVLVSTIS